MPTAALKPCRAPGCPVIGPCETHDAEYQQARAAARPWWSGWYRIARWRRLRLQVLAATPLCVVCLAAGRTEPARDVDHVIPHKGDARLFWSRLNLQALCQDCHRRKTGRGA